MWTALPWIIQKGTNLYPVKNIFYKDDSWEYASTARKKKRQDQITTGLHKQNKTNYFMANA